MQIGNKIKSFRVEKGLSLVDVAESLGVSESTYRRYESGKTYPDINFLGKMSDFFEKPIYEFFPKQIEQHNHQQVGGIAIANNSTINQLSEKIIDNYENRIAHLEGEILFLRNQVETK